MNAGMVLANLNCACSGVIRKSPMLQAYLRGIVITVEPYSDSSDAMGTNSFVGVSDKGKKKSKDR